MARTLLQDEQGSPLLEATLLLPFLLVIGLGVIEFGNLFYEQQLILSGVRDAARYVARLDNPSSGQPAATGIAVTGSIDGLGVPRVPFLLPRDITYAYRQVPNTRDAATGLSPYRGADTILIVTVTARPTYNGIGFLTFLGLGPIPLTITHEERVIHE